MIDADPENRTAGMYLRMVEQILAQEEAKEAGVPLEVEEAVPEAEADDEELNFSFDGERSSVMPAAKDADEDEEA